MKVIFYFEAVRREFRHPVRVNFFFAPWIACLFLFQACRRPSTVANPSNHLSIVGNFVGALVGATVDLREGPIFFFAVGLAHYAVLFVTLYQRLPSNETLPRELHPVFFLFVAAPTVACVAWAELSGHFDSASRIAYFIGLFLYASLGDGRRIERICCRFSLAWWAYTFPMTGAAIATIRYAGEVTNPLTETLSLALSAMSTLTMAVLLVSTVVHAVVLGDLFPNDVSIAIAESRPLDGKKKKKKKMKMNMKMKTSSVVFSPAAPLPPRPPPVEREAAVAIQIDER
ncbi:unnamed protein product [Spirodela intermedia]|uniref:Uncharacterized protein n=1 Tax=Spirodela intermedia TaxID=51605 RepID=A0A7I8IT16_SPIIN|nr:unnamed protein product [Spirodela intermedia]CAA6661023.1 unnamed protein product [Spirodela intermedia]